MMRVSLVNKNRIKSGGFGSFIEILITVAIVSFGILAFFMLLRSSHKEMALSKEFIAASNAAGRIIEMMKGVSYDKIPVTKGMVEVKSLSIFAKNGCGITGLDGAAEKIGIEELAGVKKVDVDITWRARGKESNAEASRIEFTLFKTPF